MGDDDRPAELERDGVADSEVDCDAVCDLLRVPLFEAIRDTDCTELVVALADKETLAAGAIIERVREKLGDPLAEVDDVREDTERADLDGDRDAL